MRTASPWWASLVTLMFLGSLFVSERLFDGIDALRYLVSGVSVGAIVAVAAMRVWTTMATRGSRQRVERTMLACQLGLVVALLLYLTTTDWGMRHLGMDESPKFHTAMTVVYAVLIAVSAIPLFMIEITLGTALRDNFEIKNVDGQDEGVEFFRVREIGWSGLTIALALSMLMVTCQVANERNVTKDVSYFKTSAPGDSTINIVSLAPDPIRVLLFFPVESNEVHEQVRGYFDALASESKHVQVEDHDAVREIELAGKYKITASYNEKAPKGYVVLVRGEGDNEKFQSFDVDATLESARKPQSKLRNFDREVNGALLKLVRDKRKVYLTTGHGEMNDFSSVPAEVKVPERKVTVLKKRLGELNYEVKDLGLIDLAHNVPDDATIVMILAPTKPLADAEWDALDRYLDKGGRMMIALDPKSDGSLGPLEGKFGMRFERAPLTDNHAYLPQRNTETDYRFVVTTQFSAHASTTALSRAGDKGLVLIESGALEDAPFTNRGAQPKKTYTIKSLDSSWLDYNNDYKFTSDGPKPEKKQKYNIAAAIEGPKLGKDDQGKDKDGYRVLAFADVDLFADVFVRNQIGQPAVTIVSGPLIEDSVRWLGGEEVFSGEIVTEDDTAIQHTKNQDAIWFALLLVGAPAIVLALGLVGTGIARKRRHPAPMPAKTVAKSEVKS